MRILSSNVSPKQYSSKNLTEFYSHHILVQSRLEQCSLHVVLFSSESIKKGEYSMDVNQLFLLLANALTFATAVVSLLHVASERDESHKEK